MNSLLAMTLSLSLLAFAAEASEISLRLLTPDGQKAAQGRATSFKVMLANHSPDEQLLACYIHAPESWESLPSPAQLFYLPPNTARIVPLKVRVPSEAAKGTYRIAIGVADADSQALLACDQLTLAVP